MESTGKPLGEGTAAKGINLERHLKWKPHMPSFKGPTEPTAGLHFLSWHCLTSNLLACMGFISGARTQLSRPYPLKFSQSVPQLSPDIKNARSRETPLPCLQHSSGTVLLTQLFSGPGESLQSRISGKDDNVLVNPWTMTLGISARDSKEMALFSYSIYL